MLDGRLRMSLGKTETLELAALLSLWEMHDRGPRITKESSRRMTIQSLLRQKRKQPTLDFDMGPEELHRVLPPPMWRTERACAASVRELKECYKQLLKERPEAEAEGTPRSLRRSHTDAPVTSTWQLVQDVRHDSRGVAFDSSGQVIVDKMAAERIIRARLFSDPLSFGATYRVRLWRARQQPLTTALAAINHEGLHLYSDAREPRHLHTFFYDWHRQVRARSRCLWSTRTASEPRLDMRRDAPPMSP